MQYTTTVEPRNVKKNTKLHIYIIYVLWQSLPYYY